MVEARAAGGFRMPCWSGVGGKRLGLSGLGSIGVVLGGSGLELCR